MRSDDQPIRDILDNARLAIAFARDLSPEAFAKDIKSRYAVIRCLEIISEASRRISPDVADRHPHLPWAAIRAAGNIYRHEYDQVQPDMIWATVHNDLPPLIAAMDAERGD